jgi:hypothetical protein
MKLNEQINVELLAFLFGASSEAWDRAEAK